MKTTKKGFTLIELIVVIAIIGVLAAILVPAMLGYVKKSKIQAANADAKTMLTNINAVMEELDEESISVASTCNNKWNRNNITADGDWADIIQRARDYSDSISTAHFSVYIKDGAAVAAVAKSGKYYGTYPAGLTNKNYNKDELKTATDATSGKGLGKTPDLAKAELYAAAVYNTGRVSPNLIDTEVGESTKKS